MMYIDKKDMWITLISKRGDEYGGHGGTLDLLDWCGKSALCYVTEEEARRFLDDPTQPYIVPCERRSSDI